jgi:hypothetical protein
VPDTHLAIEAVSDEALARRIAGGSAGSYTLVHGGALQR